MDSDAEKAAVAQSIGVIDTDENVNTLLNQTRLLSENAIPIPRTIGDVFKERYTKAVKMYERFHMDWEKSINAFIETGSSDDYYSAGKPRENFIRMIVQALVDIVYMQNPSAEFNTLKDEEKQLANALTAILTTLVNKKYDVGLNMRSFVVRQIVVAHLTNYGIIKLCFNDKEGSREDAIMLYQKIQAALKDEEDLDQATRYYGLLDTLYKEIQNRTNFGLKLKNVSPFCFFVDPKCEKDDLTDADWTMEIERLANSYIKSQFMTFDEDTKEYRFKYDTSVVFNEENVRKSFSPDDVKGQIIDKLMPQDSKDEREAVESDTTPCVWVEDRLTRKIYLYILGRWDTPLWVYEDQKQLSRFFSYFLLAFSPSVRGILRYSEVSYYLGFQEEVNKNNEQFDFVRNAAFSTIVYDSDAVDRAEVEKVLTEVMKGGSRLRSIGIKLKSEDKKLSDVLEAFKMPIAAMPELFNDPRYKQAIDKASRLSEALRGGEFRTNTTNEAIDVYNQVGSTRIEALTSAIEAMMSDLLWAIAEIVISKFDKSVITTLVTPEQAEVFTPMSVASFNQAFSLSVEGGSIERPNSTNKKKEAVQIIQLLGQFGTAAPRTVLGIVTKLLRSVFSRSLVTDKDLSILDEEGQAAMQKGISTQGQPQ